MAFLSPIWLLALLPFAAFAAWVLIGRRARARVPFLPLWNVPEQLRRPKKGWEPPPLAIVLALLATLATLLAVSQPTLSLSGDARTVTVLVDRGATMSAAGPTGQPRFRESIDDVSKALAARAEPTRIHLVDVLHPDATSDPVEPASLRRTAVDTSAALRPLVSHYARQTGPTLIVTDRDLGPLPEHLIRVAPATTVRNAGITSLAHRPGQLMVTVRATHAATRTLRVTTGTRTTSRSLDLPAAAPLTVFLNVPDETSDTIESTLEGGDDFAGDDTARLVRRGSWPVVETRTAAPDEVRRMVAIYTRHRPTTESSTRVAIAAPGQLRADEPGVVLAPADTSIAADSFRAADHPLTRGVVWPSSTEPLAVAAKGPGEGWTPVTWVGDRVILAVRDGPARQAWIGLDSPAFARTPGFVVLWTSLLDWVGAGGDGLASLPLDALPSGAARLTPAPPDTDPARWPGVFETPTGQVAANAGPATFGSAPTDWQARLARWPGTDAGGVALAPWLAVTAAALLLAAAGTWERRRRTAGVRAPADRPPEASIRA